MDDTCDCAFCRAGIVVDAHDEAAEDLLIRQRAAIDDLIAKCGYLPEGYAILRKHGLAER